MHAYATQNICNVVLLSHGGAGKTTLAEAMLFNAGAISRQGKVEDGNTTSDFEPEEIKRKSSVQLAILPCEWKEKKLNIIDTPGYADFIGEAISALRVADAALILVAAPAGVEVGTEHFWNLAEERSLPRLVCVSKMDRENADFARNLDALRARFGNRCVALQVPIGAQASFKGVVDLLHRKVYLNSGAEGATIPESVQAQVEQLRERLVEAVAETDEDLTTKYLEGQELTLEELQGGMRAGILSGKLVPVVAGAGSNSQAVSALMDVLVEYAPSPAQAVFPECTNVQTKDSEVIHAANDAPLVAQVFKSTADPYVGRLSYFRIFSGIMSSDSQVWNVSKGQGERLGQLFVPHGKVQEPIAQLAAGDIGAVAKLANTGTGDTLGQRDHPLLMSPLAFPEPVYSTAVHPKTKADLDKMSTALTRLCEEDPSLKMRKDPDTGEVILMGVGDSHIEVAGDKLRRKFGVDVRFDLPKIPYKETITIEAKAEYKHKKQTGGHGQYGHVFLAFEPLPRGGGNEFTDRVVGGSVPRNFIPAVGKGVVEALQEGVLGHFPVVDVRITLYDGSYHEVDSSEMAFKIAAAQAVKKGLSQAQPVLLEPIYYLKVTVPDTYMGDIIGDLNTKRARVLGMHPQRGSTEIEAEAPLAELIRYSTDLRSMTQGRGYYTMSFSRYEGVPTHITQKVVAEAKKEA